MQKAQIIYAAYLLFFILFLGAVFATPYLAFQGQANGLYKAFSFTCHQKISRSLCLFSDGNGYWVADCTQQNGTFVGGLADRTLTKVESDATIGYKMPICARDFGIYAAMLLAGLAYPFVRRLDDRRVFPAVFLILSIVPLGLDGGIQLLSDIHLLPFVYESTNVIRLLTGIIAGATAAFYAIPLLMNMFGEERQHPARKEKTK